MTRIKRTLELMVVAVLIALVVCSSVASAAIQGPIPGLTAEYWVRQLAPRTACQVQWVPNYEGFGWICSLTGETHYTLSQWGRQWGEVTGLRFDYVSPWDNADYGVAMVAMVAATPYTGAQPEAASKWATNLARAIQWSTGGTISECHWYGLVEHCISGTLANGDIYLYYTMSGTSPSPGKR